MPGGFEKAKLLQMVEAIQLLIILIFFREKPFL